MPTSAGIFPAAMASAAEAPERLDSGKVLPPGLPFSEAVRYGDTLYQHAIAGYQGKAGVMPAKGGRTDLTDELVKQAVDYEARRQIEVLEHGGKIGARLLQFLVEPLGLDPDRPHRSSQIQSAGRSLRDPAEPVHKQ